MEKFIKITDKTKIRNPLAFSGYTGQYEGNINNFLFKDEGLNQQSNFEKIQESLIQFNTKLDYIWSSKFIFPRQRTIFIAKSSDNNFYWYKYEGKTAGGGQNSLFINGNKIKVTKWLRMTSEERDQIINS